MWHWLKNLWRTPDAAEVGGRLFAEACRKHTEGDLRGAAKLLHNADLQLTKAGSTPGMRETRIMHALTLYALHDYVAAAARWQDAILPGDGHSGETAEQLRGFLDDIRGRVPNLDRALELHRRNGWDWRAEGGSPSELAAKLCTTAAARSAAGDPTGAIRLWERAEQLGREWPSFAALAIALFEQADVYAGLGNSDRALALRREAHTVVENEVASWGGTVEFDDGQPDRPVRVINLRGTRVTDANLAILRSAGRVHELNLTETDVSDGGLAWLAHLNELQVLLLQLTPVTDRGLPHLRHLTQLRTLFLGGTKVTDAGLHHLEPLAQIEVLILGGTGVTDAGLTRLPGLPALWNLDLRDTAVSDAGLAHLQQCTGLKKLNLTRTRVTSAGVLQLRAALPALNEVHK